MDGLYKKVIKGAYTKLPSHYSVDLNNIIKMMLAVKPGNRASCEKMLNLPFVLRRVSDIVNLENDENYNPAMLNTIKVPQNLHYLTDK